MATNLTIDVNINPNGQPNNTSSEINQVPAITSNNNLSQQNRQTKNLANLALIGGAVKNVASSTLGQVGAITGNATLQRRIDTISKAFGFGFAIQLNPLIGGLFVATSLANSSISQIVQVRNANLQADYNRSIRGNAYNQGRIVGGSR